MKPVDVHTLEKPLPKPQRDLLGYASARILEALLESLLALEYLGRGYTRNAAGKVFQAWRALTAAMLALEKDKLIEKAVSEEQKRWLLEKAIPRLPTTRLRALARLIEDLGYPYYTPLTDIALNLHDYQYHGPDPDLALTRYRTREEAAVDALYLIEKICKLIEEHVKPRLEKKNTWSNKHETALKQLRQALESFRSRNKRVS